MKPATIAAAAILLLAGCGGAAQRPASTPVPTVEPEIRALRAQLAQAIAQRDDALARLRKALRRKPTVVRVVVGTPAPGARASDSGQPAARVFTTLRTSP